MARKQMSGKCHRSTMSTLTICTPVSEWCIAHDRDMCIDTCVLTHDRDHKGERKSETQSRELFGCLVHCSDMLV